MTPTKNLIDDILTYLTENEEARERFNQLSSNYLKCLSRDKVTFFELTTCNRDAVSYDSQWHNYPEYIYKHTEPTKKMILLTVLSSPDGKPICEFLNKKVKQNKVPEVEYPKEVEGFLSKEEIFDIGIDAGVDIGEIIEQNKTSPATISDLLYITFTECLRQGMNFDNAYKLTNEKYNSL